jgi:hypothetical protein
MAWSGMGNGSQHRDGCGGRRIVRFVRGVERAHPIDQRQSTAAGRNDDQDRDHDYLAAGTGRCVLCLGGHATRRLGVAGNLESFPFGPASHDADPTWVIAGEYLGFVLREARNASLHSVSRFADFWFEPHGLFGQGPYLSEYSKACLASRRRRLRATRLAVMGLT